MTAATVVARYNFPMAAEVVALTVTDGYTYTSTLSTPLIANCSRNDVVCTISGRTVTMVLSGLSSASLVLKVEGYL
jgi:hypothetical protein